MDTRIDPHEYEGVQFPMTIFLSGVGNYENPYYLDYENDPLIKSIGGYCGEKVWKKFVANLNSKLWSLQVYSFNWAIRDSLFDILTFIEAINKRIFEPAGFKASLWIIEIQLHFSQDFFDYRMPSETEAELMCKVDT